jgi:hypothetical protein
MKTIFLIAAFFYLTLADAQPTIKVDVSADTIRVGETVEVTYTIENGDGNFTMPDMKGLPVISGPNSSSSFMYANGKMTSSQSYAVTLMGLEAGKLLIPETAYKTGKDTLSIKAVEVIVLDNYAKAPGSSGKTETQKPVTTREKRKF